MNMKMALCSCSHVEQGDKEHNNKESEQQQQQCLPASKSLEDSVQFILALQKEMGEEREGSRRSMTVQRQGNGYIYMCAKDILEKKWDKLCEMKEEIRKGCCWK